MTGTADSAGRNSDAHAAQRAPPENAPNFFLLGGAKCGTTSLYHLLKQVEDVYLPERKEPRFFAYRAAYARGLAWYLDEYFSGAARRRWRGEATPQYLHGGRLVADRVRASCGEDLRFVVLLRDPVARAWSHYRHARRLGIEPLSFREALAAEKDRLSENPEAWCGYFADGLYARALDDWFSVFPRDRFLVMLTDELERDP
ncbi:MAG TPA: sulfotransferase domain-containing protein, partial [Gammaproteobacteria bacterium]|nr:sulfotransferase domain-containing protein [Gammaproteobacteria bacterium]